MPPVAGHAELRERLAAAAAGGRLPQSLLFRGPPGIGKQTVALWLAGVLQCEAQTGCGRCRSCRLASELQQPDIGWYFPVERPRRTPSQRLREKLEDARLEELEARRASPLRRTRLDAATGIHLGTVENIRDQAIKRPAMGPHSIYVIGRAEQMVSQRASPEAANAFLKLLEEPPRDVHIFLTSSRPASLLPTVLSRVLSVRVLPLADEEVAAFLRAEAGASPDEAQRAARLAHGSIGRALSILAGDEEGYGEAEKLLRAALTGRRAERLLYALSLSARGARGGFLRTLEAAGQLLRDQLALASANEESVLDLESARRLSPEPPDADALLRGLERLEEAKRAAAGNVNPQAVAVALLAQLGSDLTRERHGSRAAGSRLAPSPLEARGSP